MPYLHLPVQSGSDAILAAMNRHYTQAELPGLVDRLRTRDAGPRALDRRHRRVPRRDRGGLRGHARGRARRRLRPGVHVHLLARGGHAGGDDGATRCRARSSRSASTGSSSSFRPRRCEEPRRSSAPCSLCSSRASSKRDERMLIGPHAQQQGRARARARRHDGADGLRGPHRRRRDRRGADLVPRWHARVLTRSARLAPDRGYMRPVSTAASRGGSHVADTVFGIIAPHPPILVRAVGGARGRRHAGFPRGAAQPRRALARFEPETVVVMSPHAPALSDAFVVDGARRACGARSRSSATRRPYAVAGRPRARPALLGELEAHGIPFVARVGLAPAPGLARPRHPRAALLPRPDQGDRPRGPVALLACRYERAPRLGRPCESAAAQLGRRVAFVASGDCSHRLTPDAPAGYSPRGAELDAGSSRACEAGTSRRARRRRPGPDRSGRGVRPALVHHARRLRGRRPGAHARARLRRSVGRRLPDRARRRDALALHDTLAACRAPGDTGSGRQGRHAGDDESEIVALARASDRAYVRDGASARRPHRSTDAEYPARAGAFVSLHREGDAARLHRHDRCPPATRSPRRSCQRDRGRDARPALPAARTPTSSPTSTSRSTCSTRPSVHDSTTSIPRATA